MQPGSMSDLSAECAQALSELAKMNKKRDRTVINIVPQTTNGWSTTIRPTVIDTRRSPQARAALRRFLEFTQTVFATIVALLFDGHIACHPHASRTPHVRSSKCVVHALGHSVVSADIDP